MHRSREAGRNQMENHLSRPGDFDRYVANRRFIIWQQLRWLVPVALENTIQ